MKGEEKPLIKYMQIAVQMIIPVYQRKKKLNMLGIMQHVFSECYFKQAYGASRVFSPDPFNQCYLRFVQIFLENMRRVYL